MGKCLWCGGSYFPPVRWGSFLDVRHQHGFCERCWGRFDRLEGSFLCEKCGRDLTVLSSEYVQGGVCSDCVAWGSTDILTMNRSLLTYTEFLREVVTRFKFRGDAILVEGFQDEWQKLYNRYFEKCVPVPIPLSAERLAERHFNQAWMLASLLQAAPVNLLRRVKHADTKQSKKNRRERLAGEENPFILADGVEDFSGKSFVIIDDIYTTGTTVRHAAHALEVLAPSAIYSMTLAR